MQIAGLSFCTRLQQAYLLGMNWNHVQSLLRQHKIDAWLVYDFRGSNSVFSLLLPGKRVTTRRAALLIPAHGTPTLLCQGLDSNQFEHLQGVQKEHYLGWRDLHAWLSNKLGSSKRVAMEYAPGCTLPVVSIVDAGIVDLVRAIGVEVVSSADVLQMCVATWSDAALETHMKASREVARIKDDAFDYIRASLKKGERITEYMVQQRIVENFRAAGLEVGEPPIVAANGHAGDPHFEVSASNPSVIVPGDWILIDLWSRYPGFENIYSDITWVGYCTKNASDTVPTKHREVFETVRASRDAAVNLAKQRWNAKQSVQGWELDDASRNVIVHAGFERFVKHRTGHSLSPGPRVHGLGVNLDNLETHDTREVLPGLGYTIEPGIYMPELGVRLEINVYTDAAKGPVITSCVQDEVVMC